MSVEVTVPALGESIVEATVGRWLKNEGDEVAVGDALVELETDKVNQEISATQSGVLQSIVKREGETVGIGDVLAIVGDGQTAGGNGSAPASTPSTRQAGPSTPAAPAPQAGEPATSGNEEAANGDASRASPVARRIAAEHDIDLNLVTGSGPSGRIKKEDVEAYLREREAAPTPASAPSSQPPASTPARTPTPPSAPSPAATTDERPEERVRMSRRRQTIARRLVEAQHSAAMLTTFNEVDMSAIMALRSERKDTFKERHGVGLGFMSFFTKAVVGALKAFPRLNAEIQGDEMVLKRYYDIGIAVGADEGLVVPVVRDADRLSFAEIESRIADLAARVRDGTLGLEELQGGTFTISNGGIYGSLLSTPILNTPQVGILGMHKIEERPVAVDGKVVVRPMMYLALSYDHRIVDGSEAVRFLVRVKELLEDPTSLLLEG